MARLPDAFIDDLLARTDIVEVVNARVPLKRKGKEWTARCPFHDERTPSFYVVPHKQFYKCFGCGASGTAINFVMQYDRLEFLDAVEELAKRAGMEMPRDNKPRDADDDSRELYAALEAAAKFFQRELPKSDKARAYFDARGVDAATREQFQLGYAPEGFSALKDTLGGDERRMKLLERGGMFSRSDKGHVYDKFRNRVMFPICDRRGRAIAFGGRVIDKDDSPKYLNSPETQLFHKGRELYGLWQARQANQKLDRLIVVEGYMDVVSLFQFGVTQAVATLGTATTPDHAELLFRNAPDAYFCFDGDKAGRGAAWKAVESVLPRMKDGRQAFFLFLPEGEDPDTIVRSQGKDAFDARLRDATPLSQFFFDEMGKDVNLRTLDGKAKLAERCKPLLAQIPDGAFADLMRARLAELTGIGAQAQAVPTAHATMPPRRAGVRPTQKMSLVRSAIVLLLHAPDIALEVPAPFAFAGLRLPGIELLCELLDVIHARPGIGVGALVEHFEGHEQFAALQKLALQELPGEEAAWRSEFLDAIAQLEKQAMQQRIDELETRMREAGLDNVEKYELRALLAARAKSH